MICRGSRLGRIHGVSRVDRRVRDSQLKDDRRSVESDEVSKSASGTRVEASRGVGIPQLYPIAKN